LLEEGETTQIRNLAPTDAIVQLMRQSFRPFFLTSQAQQQKALVGCTQVASNVAVFTLTRAKKISSTAIVIEMLLANA
jgi:hypothetical protein